MQNIILGYLLDQYNYSMFFFRYINATQSFQQNLQPFYTKQYIQCLFFHINSTFFGLQKRDISIVKNRRFSPLGHTAKTKNNLMRQK